MSERDSILDFESDLVVSSVKMQYPSTHLLESNQ